MLPSTDDYGHLEMGGVVLEIVNADEKVASGAAGTVVYWAVDDLDAEVLRLGQLGAPLYRGPLALGMATASARCATLGAIALGCGSGA